MLHLNSLGSKILEGKDPQAEKLLSQEGLQTAGRKLDGLFQSVGTFQK